MNKILDYENLNVGQYIFNQLYVNDYAVWIQNVPRSHLQSLASALSKTLNNLTKDDLGLEIVELEQAAQLAIKEEEEANVNEISDVLHKTKIIDSDDSDDDSSSSNTDSDDDSASE